MAQRSLVGERTTLTEEAQLPLRQWAARLPKIDLHRHLEGSLRLNTLAEIAMEHGIDLPSYDTERLRPYVQITDDPPDFYRFLEKFRLLRRFYTSKEAVQRVAHEAVMDAAADNIRYLELRFNPVALSRAQDFPLADVVEWVVEAIAKAQEESGTRTCLILQIGREEESLDVAYEIVELAIAHFGPLVRGVDLAGNEAKFPDHRRFAGPFRRAREAGLHITVHAGEVLGPESIHSALTYLRPERIGHGIHAVEDSELVQQLRQERIALEVCPTSNLQTGAVRNIALHPLVDIAHLDLRFTINTDDPSISDTTLTDEYVVVVGDIGLERWWVYRAMRNAVEAAFIPDEERAWLRGRFREWLSPYPGAVETFDALAMP